MFASGPTHRFLSSPLPFTPAAATNRIAMEEDDVVGTAGVRGASAKHWRTSAISREGGGAVVGVAAGVGQRR